MGGRLSVASSSLLILGLAGCGARPAPASEPGPQAPTQQPVQPTPPPTAGTILTPEPTPWEPQPPSHPCEPSETRTCNVLYLLADEYDDEHVLRTEPYFEEAGYRTVVASNTLEVVHGFHECYGFTPAAPDLVMDDVELGDYDAVLFTGGDGVSSGDWLADPAAHRIAQQAMEQGKVIAAIGDAPALLARAGVMEGRAFTVLHDLGWYGITDQWIDDIEARGGLFVDRSPVRDGLLITAGRASAVVVWAILEVVDEQQR